MRDATAAYLYELESTPAIGSGTFYVWQLSSLPRCVLLWCGVYTCVVQAKLLCRLLDAATGMAYLHGKGVLHGDLKAGNVLLQSTVHGTYGQVGWLQCVQGPCMCTLGVVVPAVCVCVSACGVCRACSCAGCIFQQLLKRKGLQPCLQPAMKHTLHWVFTGAVLFCLCAVTGGQDIRLWSGSDTAGWRHTPQHC
jgi:hypothetical protein